MDSGTLSDASVDAFVRERFIAVRIEKEHQTAAYESLKLTGLPCTLLLRPDRTEVARFNGLLGPKEFVEKVGAAASKH